MQRLICRRSVFFPTEDALPRSFAGLCSGPGCSTMLARRPPPDDGFTAKASMSSLPGAYQISKGSALSVDRAFSRTLIAERAQRRLLAAHVVPIRSGFAWKVPAGHLFRIVTLEGPQVADLNLWNLHNPRERMWAAR